MSCGVFQSTRPHGARHTYCGSVVCDSCFNPRARMGRDIRGDRFLTLWGSFNPRARMGRDEQETKIGEYYDVSIHAPAWGASLALINGFIHSLFQSTRPHGARPSTNAKFKSLVEFQSTRPHGARHSLMRHTALFFKFQSTRPHGARLSPLPHPYRILMFQSTRPHGARLMMLFALALGVTFQSTRPHGARRWLLHR